MVVIVKAILVYVMIVSIAMLLQGNRKEHIVTDEISSHLDLVLKDKDYLCHLEYLKNRESEKKSLASHSYSIHKSR